MTSKKITSLTNARVKHVVALRDRKTREAQGLTIVEGVREIQRAKEARVTFKEMYTCQPTATPGVAVGAPVFETTKEVFSKISYGDRSEGVLAVCAPRPMTFKDFAPKAAPLFVVVEGVEKPGNLGAILRTCDGAGVDGVIVCDGKTDMTNPNVIRASLGTLFSVKVVTSSNKQALDFLKSKNIKICATLPQAKTLYTKAKLTDALAIVVGSEQDGLTKFWIKHADLKVKIPMRGKVDSLNVSASTAILLYEAVRQRVIAGTNYPVSLRGRRPKQSY